MDPKERIRQVVEILKNEGRLQSNQLVNRIVDAGLMAKDTARKTIAEGVQSRQIFKEEAMKGKLKIVFYTIYPDIAENEKFQLDQMEKLLKQFDLRFAFFKKNYSKLSMEEKAAGIEAFFLFVLHFLVTVEALWGNFGKTRKWSTLLNEIRARNAPINNLMISGSKREHGEIARHIIEGKFSFLGEAINQLDEHLHKIREQV